MNPGDEILRRFQRRWLSLLFRGVLCLALSLGGNTLAAPFAGVTDIQIQPRQGDQLRLHFESDFPFQYDLQVLDANTLVLKLINARLAGKLAQPDGRLNTLIEKGQGEQVVETARLVVNPANGEESLILKGPGLGNRILTVTGATPLALAQPPNPSPSPKKKAGIAGSETITLPDFKALSSANATPPDKANIRLDAPLSGSAPFANAPQKTSSSKDKKSEAHLRPGGLKHLGEAGIRASLAQGIFPQERDNLALGHRSRHETSLPSLSQHELPDAEEAFLALLKADEEPGFVPRLSNAPIKSEAPLQAVIGETREEIIAQHRPSPPVQLDPFSEKYDPASALQHQNPTGPKISAIKTLPYNPGQEQTIEMPGAQGRKKLETPTDTARSYSYAPIPGYYPPGYSTPDYGYQRTYDAPQAAYAKPPAQAPPLRAPAITERQLIQPLPRYRGDASAIQYQVSGSDQVHTLPPGQVEADFDLGDSPSEAVSALSFDPTTAEESAEAHMYQALSHYRRQNYDRALEMVEQAALMDPDNPNIQAALAEILIKLDHPKQAVKAYEKALKYAEKPALKEKYIGRYAVALYLRGERKKAVDTLETLLTEQDNLADPQYVVHFILGTLYQELGEMEPAIVHLQRAAQLNPASPDVQFGLGLTYELSGNVAAAKAHYSKALQLKPGSRDIALALERVKG